MESEAPKENPPAEKKEADKKAKKDAKRGGKGFGKGKGGRRGQKPEEQDWVPLTNLGRLVKQGIITELETIFYHSIPIKEYQIVDFIMKNKKITLKEECMKIKSVQKQTKAGQRTRFKAVVAVGDGQGHIGVGSKLAKEVQVAMKGATIAAKLNMIPVRRGYWGGLIGKPHTIATKVTGKCGSVRLRLVPAPKGTGIVGAPPTKKLLGFAGVEDIFSQSTGSTDTMENFVRAIYDALYKSYKYLSPELWNKGDIKKNIFADNIEKLKEYKYKELEKKE
jgi:small subunit ribosomal protein S2e